MTPVNDAPENAVPGVQSMYSTDIKFFGSNYGNRIMVNDVDSGSGFLDVKLTATNGLLSLDGVNWRATLTFNDMYSATQINELFNNALRFKPTITTGSANIELFSSDNGNAGSFGDPVGSDTDNIGITVAYRRRL